MGQKNICLCLVCPGYMVFKNCFLVDGSMQWNLKAVGITIVLVMTAWGYKRIRKKQLSGVSLILISAVLGILVY